MAWVTIVGILINIIRVVADGRLPWAKEDDAEAIPLLASELEARRPLGGLGLMDALRWWRENKDEVTEVFTDAVAVVKQIMDLIRELTDGAAPVYGSAAESSEAVDAAVEKLLETIG